MAKVVSVDSPGELDAFSKSATWIRSASIDISRVFTHLRTHEDFAAHVGDRLREETNMDLVECVPRTGLHHFLTFSVEYEGMTQEDLFSIWSEEAKAALEAKKVWNRVGLVESGGRTKGDLICLAVSVDFVKRGLRQRGWLDDDYHDSCLSLYNAFKSSHTGEIWKIREIWKIPGEHKLIGVISVDSPGRLDSWAESSWEHLVNGISTVFTPLRPYEDFAANVRDWLKEDVNISPEYCPSKSGLHYFLTFTVEYEGMTQEELFKVWIDEAKAALEAKKSGTILDLWKVVAQRKVMRRDYNWGSELCMGLRAVSDDTA
ncbi:hypothetical protein AWC38_SpisGene11117 [Stylophora pistillata]|uniref:Uncharacterized protein n=1 Tax=Stylophora pistillata TaxID=50429 RepID=A0A2B4S6V3_STYPI|nr:hypothetical protein AWC38_SpisGene11117 [Stylophora pistillata]